MVKNYVQVPYIRPTYGSRHYLVGLSKYDRIMVLNARPIPIKSVFNRIVELIGIDRSSSIDYISFPTVEIVERAYPEPLVELDFLYGLFSMNQLQDTVCYLISHKCTIKYNRYLNTII